MKKQSYRNTAIFNFFTAICFTMYVIISDSSDSKYRYGFLIPAFLFVVIGIMNLYRHRKERNKTSV